jgi:release factor glutamine methyltransferase
MAPSVLERIAAARETLVRAGVARGDAAFDAELLARHALGWDRAQLISRGGQAPPQGFEAAYEQLVARRAAREPVALITGVREFWGRDFEVTRDTLIPRPETEFIVEEAMESFRARHPRAIIDVGTGTGCIAVSLGCEFPRARVVATDISEGALDVARRNAARHGITDRIEFVRTHLMNGVTVGADLIVSNPPYVVDSAAPALSPEVVNFEPHDALFGGPDGLAVIRELLAEAPARLAPGGLLVVEFGFGQEADVCALAERAGWTVLRLRQDLQGIPRTIVLRRSNERA